MSPRRLATWQRATLLVPLALLSSAWTAGLAVSGTASESTDDRPTLPDGTVLPDQALKAPASVSKPASLGPGVPADAAATMLGSASVTGIPDAALAAYQRAEQVINKADRSCRIDWELVAAIGKVESDHGRYGGSTLSQDGVSTPAIYGVPLDGSNGTARITDTDAGQFDQDPVLDQAVGPMQFIPSTWSVVGVDGDGDGERNPQDIDDAALATAVYLCSGEQDLSTESGRDSAVLRYNHSREYVDLVLAIMHAYMRGDFTSVPTGTAAAAVYAPSYDAVFKPSTQGARRGGEEDRRSVDSAEPTTTVEEGSTDGSTGSGEETTSDPVETTEKTVTDTTDKLTGGAEGSTADTLTYAEAKAKCLAQGITLPTQLEACIDDLM